MPKANVLNRKLITWGCRSSTRRRCRWSSGWWRAWTSIFFATITSIKLSLGRGRFLVTLLQRLSLDIETCRHYKKQEWVSPLGMFLEKIYSFKNISHAAPAQWTLEDPGSAQGTRKTEEKDRKPGNVSVSNIWVKNVFNLTVPGVNILNNLLKVENSDIPGQRIMFSHCALILYFSCILYLKNMVGRWSVQSSRSCSKYSP